MELWVWFSFGTIILNAALMLIDYNLLEKVYKSAEAPAMITSLFLIFPFVGGLIYGVDYSNIGIIVGAMIVGILLFLAELFYFKSFATGVTPAALGSILKIQLVFAFIVGVFLFGEHLTNLQYLGHAIIFGGVLYLTLGHFGVSKNYRIFIFPILSAVLYSASTIGLDSILKAGDFVTIFTFYAFGHILGGIYLLFCSKGGKSFKLDFLKKIKFFVILIFFTESLNVGVYFVETLAYKYGPLSKVTFLNETYPVLLVLLSFSVGYLFPKYFPKEGGENKVKTLAIVVIMLLGVYLTIK